MWARKFGVKAAETPLLLGLVSSLINHGGVPYSFDAPGQKTSAQTLSPCFCESTARMVKQSQDDGLISRYFSAHILPAPVLLPWQGRDEQAPPTPELTSGGTTLLLTVLEDFLCLPIHHSQDLDYTSENRRSSCSQGAYILWESKS